MNEEYFILSVFFRRAFLLTFLLISFFAGASKEIAPLTQDDFSFVKGNIHLSVGENLNDKNIGSLGVPESIAYVGFVPSGAVNYHFYSRFYNGLIIYTSNWMWDKTDRSSMDYIIHQVILTSSDYATARNIRPGSTFDEVIFQYGSHILKGEEVKYFADGKSLVFTIKNNKVVKIEVSANDESEQ